MGQSLGEGWSPSPEIVTITIIMMIVIMMIIVVIMMIIIGIVENAVSKYSLS